MSNSLRAFLFPSYFPPLLPFQSRPLPPSLPPPPQTILPLFIFIVSVYFLSVIPPSLLPLIIFQYRFCFVHSVFLSALYFYPIFFSCFVFWLSFGSFPILSFFLLHTSCLSPPCHLPNFLPCSLLSTLPFSYMTSSSSSPVSLHPLFYFLLFILNFSLIALPLPLPLPPVFSFMLISSSSFFSPSRLASDLLPHARFWSGRVL